MINVKVAVVRDCINANFFIVNDRLFYQSINQQIFICRENHADAIDLISNDTNK